MHVDDQDFETELRALMARTAETVNGAGVEREAILRDAARRRRRRRAVGSGLAVAAVAAAVAALVMLPGLSRQQADTVIEPQGRVPDPPTVDQTPTTRVPTTSRPESTTTSTPTTTSTTLADALPEFPPEATDLSQGRQAWAVYLAVAPEGAYDSPELLAADAAAGEAGYPSGQGFSSLACDSGAPEALGLPGSSVAAALYFEAQDQAIQARDAFESRGQAVVGVVEVTMYCVD
ncbi:MAG TPA: hypothetical protein VFZ79_16565 [Acidimicrobiales bacterium]